MAVLRALRLTARFLRRTPVAAAFAAAGFVAATLAVVVLPAVDDGFEPIRFAPRPTRPPAATRPGPTPPRASGALFAAPAAVRSAQPTPPTRPLPPTVKPSAVPPTPTGPAPTPTPRVIVPPTPVPTPHASVAAPPRTARPPDAINREDLDAPATTLRPTSVATAKPPARSTARPTPRSTAAARTVVAERAPSRTRPPAIPLASAADRAAAPPAARRTADGEGGRDRSDGRADRPARDGRDAGEKKSTRADRAEVSGRDGGRAANGNGRSSRNDPSVRDDGDRGAAKRDGSPDRGKGSNDRDGKGR